MKIGEIEKERIKDYIKKNIPSLINLTEEICRIPSPTGQEEKKAHSIFDRLSEDQVSIDEVENVLYLHNNIDESNRIIVVAAHIDTVFPDNIEIKPEIRDNKLYAPSVLDNSVNVAALLFIIEMFNKLNINFKKGILFAFNVGEEGLGNLKGIRHIVDKWKSNIDGVIAVDGGYEKIVNKAVGSMRYRLEINTEGGHSLWRALRGIWPRVQESYVYGLKASLNGWIAGMHFTGKAGIFAPIGITPHKNGVIALAPQHEGNYLITACLDIQKLYEERSKAEYYGDKNYVFETNLGS
jgi:hypothetical protein